MTSEDYNNKFSNIFLDIEEFINDAKNQKWINTKSDLISKMKDFKDELQNELQNVALNNGKPSNYYTSIDESNMR